jgi:hypothetical protein
MADAGAEKLQVFISYSRRDARNPCLRRGPLSVEYWLRLPNDIWRGARALIGLN